MSNSIYVYIFSIYYSVSFSYHPNVVRFSDTYLTYVKKEGKKNPSPTIDAQNFLPKTKLLVIKIFHLYLVVVMSTLFIVGQISFPCATFVLLVEK